MPGLTAASNVRTGQPNQDAVSSSVSTFTSTAPARSDSRASSDGAKVWMSTTASSAAASDEASSSASSRRYFVSPGSRPTRRALHQVSRERRRAT